MIQYVALKANAAGHEEVPDPWIDQEALPALSEESHGGEGVEKNRECAIVQSETFRNLRYRRRLTCELVEYAEPVCRE